MKNKKRTYIVVGLLIAIVALGIGYATVTNLLLINGTATAVASDGADVTFDSTTAPTVSGGQTGTAAAIDSNDATNHTATCTVVLKNANESATCTYTIKNTSSDTALNATSIAATVYESDGSTAWTNGTSGSASSEYFDITTAVTANQLAYGATTTVTVTVTLKAANLTGSDVTETFKVKVAADTVQAS